MPQPHKFETVGMIPKSYFDQEHVIYGFTERVIDGDTIRVRHIPNYILKRYILQTFHPMIYQHMITPLQQRGIAHETLSIRLYGVDCPELSKRTTTTSSSQPFAIEAKEYTTQLCHHQIVKITLLRRDQYQRAVAKVEVWTPSPSVSNTNSWWSSLTSRRQKKKKQRRQRHVDVSMELAQAGLAELYMGGGAEYHHSYDEFERVIHEAQRHRRGIWSIPQHQYISAAEYKERQKQKPRQQPSKSKTQQNKKRVNGYVVDATTTTATTTTNANRWRSKQNPKLAMISRTPTTSTMSDTTSHTYRNDHHQPHSNSKQRREDQQHRSHRRGSTNKPSKTTNTKSTMFETAITGLEIMG